MDEEKIDKRLIRGRKQAPVITFEERQKIEELLNLGWSCSSIARFLSRGKNTIVSEVRKKSINGKYTAIGAQEYTEKKQKQGYLKMINHPNRKRFSNGINTVYLDGRINKIESQLEIIIDVLKEITERK